MEIENSLIPSPQMAQNVVAKTFGCGCHSVKRFSTGLCHYVFGVHTTDKRNLVVRIAEPKTHHLLKGGVFWSKKLRPHGVPLPELIAYDTEACNPFMILEWLPGEDLGNCYQQLSVQDKKILAEKIFDIQTLVHKLPKATGFGYAVSYGDPNLANNLSWLAVINDHLAKARSAIRKAGVCDEGYVDRGAAAVEANRAYFEQVEPIPFLDDITTKNVMIHHGQLSGIVDVDEICFGDPLLTVALTRMALLQEQYETDYIDYWQSLIQPNPDQEAALDIYTALFCITFMGEIGQQFNKNSPSPMLPERIRLYKQVLDELLS